MKGEGKIVAIVVAGGKGVRAGFARPKQFAPIRGVPAVVRALAPLLRAPEISVVAVAVHPRCESQTAEIFRRASGEFSGLQSVRILSVGKESRAGTVAAAVGEICADDDWALVHDAARPFLKPELLARVVSAARRDGVGAAPLSPLSEALKIADDSGRVLESVPRAGFFLAQTPQMFRAGLLKKALAQSPQADDECEAMHRAGFQFQMTPGDRLNIKLTFPADYVLAESLAAAPDAAEEGAQ